MGEKTAISWTEATWNPWQGCTKVSPGCAHCYMYRDKYKYGQDPTKVVRSKPPTFDKPLTWKDGKIVFTCSWSDFFHEDADAWRDDAWDIIRRTPQHTYQILTKRPERILEHLPADWGNGWSSVWIGTSVENQHFADIRIPQLLAVPAEVHFLSCEPLLGDLNLRQYLSGNPVNVSWVIAGGESGVGYRVMQPDWARSLRDQCQDTNVAFWYKQDSGLRPGSNPVLDGVSYQQFPKAA